MMADVFLSYTEADAAIAERIASAIEGSGWSVWHWKRDIVHSIPHPEQTFAQIDRAGCFICIISPHTLETEFVFPEILRASAKRKSIIVVLCGLSYGEFERTKPRWCQAFGFAPAIDWGNQDQQRQVDQVIQAVRHAVGDGGGPGQADVLYFFFWGPLPGGLYELQWPPQGGPSACDLRMPVGIMASPGYLNVVCGMKIPASAQIHLWHLESRSILPRDKSLSDAGVKSGDTVVFVYEKLGEEETVFCQIVTLGKQAMRKQGER
jgi:hypothetical protein